MNFLSILDSANGIENSFVEVERRQIRRKIGRFKVENSSMIIPAVVDKIRKLVSLVDLEKIALVGKKCRQFASGYAKGSRQQPWQILPVALNRIVKSRNTD